MILIKSDRTIEEIVQGILTMYVLFILSEQQLWQHFLF